MLLVLPVDVLESLIFGRSYVLACKVQAQRLIRPVFLSPEDLEKAAASSDDSDSDYAPSEDSDFTPSPYMIEYFAEEREWAALLSQEPLRLVCRVACVSKMARDIVNAWARKLLTERETFVESSDGME